MLNKNEFAYDTTHFPFRDFAKYECRESEIHRESAEVQYVTLV